MSHQLTTVVSWTNAEQRLYGARHWFWAVWHVDAVPDYSWNRTEPVESGFCKTKAEARNAAGANRRDVLQRNLWSQQYLEFQRETEKRPFFSRIRSGSKWFWCVGWDLIDDPEFTGFSSTSETALGDARLAAGREVQVTGNWMARVALRHVRAEKIRQRQAQRPRGNHVPMDAKSVSECCQVLGIPVDSSIDDVKSAYRKLALIHHPDLGGNAAEFIRIHTFYEQALARAKY
ncbi:MAG: DnaJ domain-containing protein [Planctomycetaceae bacterium]|nr:DnaJ domain-containing protein [Planctomycetaceae bacterium]